MNFQRYNDIENSYNQKIISYLSLQEILENDWYVFEKVDGSNFSYYTDGLEIKYGKRSNFITSQEKFFNCLEVAPRYDQQIKKLFNLVKDKYPNTIYMILYGEFYGGKYPNAVSKDDIKPVMVNKNVYYCPHNDFIAFDLCIFYNTNYKYLDITEFLELVSQTDIPYLKPLFKGTFEQAINFNHEFITLIPEIHNLESVENNFAEGIVIKPEKLIYVHSSRFSLKKKITKFSEKKPIAKNSLQPNSIQKKDREQPLDELTERVLEYVTEARLSNVISKIGQVTEKDKGTILKDFNADIIKDYNKENELLKPTEYAKVKRLLSMKCLELVNNYFST